MTTYQAEIRANASPTKEFFVEMLTRDVRMPMAVLDLVDNCIDGALRLREDASLDDLTVRITLSENSFTIEDNCGGIPLDVAVNYAFRFGRSVDAPGIDNSVGRFGVGMKRALFKFGRHFEVATTTKSESYRIATDVDEWLIQENEWSFPILDLERFEAPLSEQETGTKITVSRLTSEARNWFATEYYVSNLKSEISRRHQYHIDRGLHISLGGVAIPTSELKFLVSRSPLLRPAYKEYESGNVHVRILAGIGPSIPQEAGWYIYCNGRMVLDADRTRTTGWGEPRMMPRYHNQYSRFRGAVFFDSVDSKLLPWNTTKDGVDESVPVYVEAYGLMLTVMRQVIRFLDEVDRESDTPEGSRTLVDLLERQTTSTSIADLSRSENFRYVEPPPPPPPSERLVNIQYRKPVRLVEAVRKNIRAGSARAAGEATFDYYVEQEDIDAT